jgi:hypothetical protein
VAVGCSALSGFLVVTHRNDHIALFMTCADIPVSLGHLFQRIPSINDRFYLARLYQLFEED